MKQNNHQGYWSWNPIGSWAFWYPVCLGRALWYCGVLLPWPHKGCASAHAQLCLTFQDPMDCSPPGSSVHGILRQEYSSVLPFPSPEDLPNPGIESMSPTLAGRFFTVWATREASTEDMWSKKWHRLPPCYPWDKLRRTRLGYACEDCHRVCKWCK